MIVLTSFLESFVDVKVKGWLRFTSDQREQCITKLQYGSLRSNFAQLTLAHRIRDLKRERDGIAQSTAVDAGELADQLK